MITKILLFVCICNVSLASDKTIRNFTTNIAILNNFTVKFNKSKSEFMSDNYDRYYLYRALVLNNFIMFNIKHNKLKEYFCSEYKSQTINLLKWKMSNKINLMKTRNAGIDCEDEFSKSQSKIYELMNDMEYEDANIEFYQFIQKSDSESTNNIHLLLPALYRRPDVSILELLMLEYKNFGMKESEWNTSILAARYGSRIALENLISLVSLSEAEFLIKVKKLIWDSH